MKDESLVKMFAVGALTAIEIVALLKNINGAMLATVVAAIAGILGYSIGKKE